MNVLSKKIGIVLLSFTLILLSVIPVFADAQGPMNDTGAKAPPALPSPGLAAKAAEKAVDVTLGIQTYGLRIALFIIFKLTAGLIGLVGQLLDQVMIRTVVNFSDVIKDMTAINKVWATIRDLGNMAFIFVLLYHGIRMVLGVSSTDIKKVIFGIFTAALLVNFSLFFTKAIIDASNIVTLGFYNSIAAAGGGSRTVGEEISDFGFSGAFMKPLGLTGLFDLSGVARAFTTSLEQGMKLQLFYIGGIIFMIVTMFIFLAVSVLFILRFVAFIILMIMSPLAFLAIAIPGLEGMKKKYWDTLSSQALFGPVYMFYTFIILRLMGPGGIAGSSDKPLSEALMDPKSDSVSVIITFVILIALLLISLIEAKKQATSGGFISSSIVNKGTSFLGGAVFGGAAALGRNTIGAAAYKMSNDSDLRAKAAAGDKFAQLRLKTLKGVAGSSFDARSSSIGKEFQSRTETDFGKGSLFNQKNTGEKGYVGKIERRAKEEAEYIKSLKPTKEEEDNAKERANNTKNSDAFKKEEQARKDRHFNEAYRAEVDARRKPLEDALELATKEKNAVDESIQESEKEIEETKKIIEDLKVSSQLDPRAKKARVDAEKKLESQVQALKSSKELAEQKKKVIIDAEKELIAFNTKEKQKEDSWESAELKELIALSGGRQGEKGKEDIKAKSEYQRLGEEAAKAFETRADASKWTKAWNGNAVLNKKIAEKIRSEIKAKSDEQQLAEIIKKQAKEAKEAEEKASKSTKSEQKKGDNKETT